MIEPVLTPQVVAVVLTLAGKVVTLLAVIVSELVRGVPVQELNVVLITYFVVGAPGGGQIAGKVISKIPAVVVAVSALAMNTPASVKSCALTKLDVPPLGVNR